MSIVGKLHSRSGQVQFVCGSDLFELIRRHWPDFYADETSVVDRYIQRLTQDLNHANKLASVTLDSGLGEIEDADHRIYVQPSFFRTVNYFDLHISASSLILGGRSLMAEWMSTDLRHIEIVHQNLVKLLVTCSDWQLTSTVLSENDIANVDSELTELRLGILACWESCLSKLIGQPYLEDGDVTPSSAAPVIEVVAEGDLTQQVESLGGEILKLLDPLVNASKLSTPTREVVSSDAGTLASKPFRGMCKVSDCCEDLPEIFLDFKGTIRHEFDKSLFSQWNESVLVSGGPGSGKTAFCRWNAL
ncbi:MAG: hypothetical protein AAFX06_21535 [Planctomycetota bacterium]